MRIRHPEVELVRVTDEASKLLEYAGRTCYQSGHKIHHESDRPFLEKIMSRGHLSVLEHASMTMKVICDRGVTHEWVRHRLFSYSQESTRYCNYGGKHMEFIIPAWFNINRGSSMTPPFLTC